MDAHEHVQAMLRAPKKAHGLHSFPPLDVSLRACTSIVHDVLGSESSTLKHARLDFSTAYHAFYIATTIMRADALYTACVMPAVREASDHWDTTDLAHAASMDRNIRVLKDVMMFPERMCGREGGRIEGLVLDAWRRRAMEQMYMPGGPGYEVARASFRELARTQGNL